DRRLALKKRAAQLPFEVDNGVGQRGLRDAAASGCPGEIVLLAERQEIADLLHLHGPPRIVGCACLGGCHRLRICMVRQLTQAPLFLRIFDWPGGRAECIPCVHWRTSPPLERACSLFGGKTGSARLIAISYNAPAAERSPGECGRAARRLRLRRGGGSHVKSRGQAAGGAHARQAILAAQPSAVSRSTPRGNRASWFVHEGAAAAP